MSHIEYLPDILGKEHPNSEQKLFTCVINWYYYALLQLPKGCMYHSRIVELLY